LHHVREAAANVLVWDIAFLLLGVALVVAGYAVANRSRDMSTVELRRRRVTAGGGGSAAALCTPVLLSHT
jgi:hypothetical protein